MEPQSQSHSEHQLGPTRNQEIVWQKHNKDMGRLKDFIKKEWPVPPRTSGSTIKLENFCCPFVSTTLNSTVFIISIGLNSAFTRNTYSADRDDPWAISMQNPDENPELAKFISEQWEKMKLQGSCEGIDLIAKHIVYDASDVNSPPQLVSLECDNQTYVRARLPHSNITIWSHPPRDQALRASIRGHLEEGKGKCKQKLGNVEKCAKDMEKQTCSTQDWEKERRKTRNAFNKFYEDFRNILGPEELPFSFQLPTIQLEYGKQRYGNLSSGVYKANDNEAHNVFTVSGVLPRNSKKDVYDSTIGKILMGITFEQLMTDDVENEADGKYQE
ncbi:uncharacterized protein LOC114525235 [Dendronephthya gigantea]|uniref:uncharacterized protein LOC114525235 n=1 Tax=Dendronephthya gigantea TaxID=151771 RepID=UPI00106A250E|nr:uncharacterized protein LOC114525235 [Dendronephthya gigantea]